VLDHTLGAFGVQVASIPDIVRDVNFLFNLEVFLKLSLYSFNVISVKRVSDDELGGVARRIKRRSRRARDALSSASLLLWRSFRFAVNFESTDAGKFPASSEFKRLFRKKAVGFFEHSGRVSEAVPRLDANDQVKRLLTFCETLTRHFNVAFVESQGAPLEVFIRVLSESHLAGTEVNSDGALGFEVLTKERKAAAAPTS